jgi:hypothetical protein
MKVINGSAAFCVGRPANECRDNQARSVNPSTGALYIAFINAIHLTSQYLMVKSFDGGTTLATFFVTPIFDINPRAN